MSNLHFEITSFNVNGHIADINIKVSQLNKIRGPHITARFDNGKESRRIRLAVISAQNDTVIANGKIELDNLFYRNKSLKNISVTFYLSNGSDTNLLLCDEPYTFSTDIKAKQTSFFAVNNKEKAKRLVKCMLKIISLPFNLLKVKKNRISFLSNRTDSPQGNLKAVLDRVKQNDELDVRVLCSAGTFSGIKGVLKFLYLYNTSSAVFVDDYYHMISFVKKKENVTLYQLWHACGAFKTFGFSRLGTDSKLEQSSPNHRQYDFAVVSSKEVAPCYAEGFGISDERIVTLGSPRCDLLVNDVYKMKYLDDFCSKYPYLKNKKIVLFAPTFRGGGNGDAYYPFEKFDVEKLLDSLNDDYVVAIKMHPYVSSRPSIDKKYNDRYFDFSNEDVNNLLFVSDILITDYSSVIYEAALLNVPILFFAFDLDEYITSRDFYIDYQSFVPGNIATCEDELIQMITERDFGSEKLAKFRLRYFGDTIGKASENVYRFMMDKMSGE